MHLLKGRKMNELTNPLTPTLGPQSYKDRRDCSSHLHGTRRISGPDLDSWHSLLPGCHCHNTWLLHLSAAQTPLHILSCWQCSSQKAGCEYSQDGDTGKQLQDLPGNPGIPPLPTCVFSPLPTCVFSPRGLQGLSKHPSFCSLCIWSPPRLYFSFFLFPQDRK